MGNRLSDCLPEHKVYFVVQYEFWARLGVGLIVEIQIPSLLHGGLYKMVVDQLSFIIILWS